MQFFTLQFFSLFLFDSNNEVDLYCRIVDFVTTPCCFQAPRIFVVPRSVQKSCGDRAFAVAAPRLWNALLIHMGQPGFS